MRLPTSLPGLDDRPTPPPWRTVVEFLAERTGDPEGVCRRVADGEVVLGDGTRVEAGTPYLTGAVVHLYRDLPEEVMVPFEIEVIEHDEATGLLVVDKPPFLATMPRGGHVMQTVLTRLRHDLDLAHLAPVHRLDRLTSGVLLLTTRAEARRPYQELVQSGGLAKTYEALAGVRVDLALPATVRNRIVKQRGVLQAEVDTGDVNAQTLIELLGISDGLGRYRLTPTTGRTHQLRLHLAGLGIPIQGDPLYPVVTPVAAHDFSTPLQLLAAQVAFVDPVTGRERAFSSSRRLPIAGEDPAIEATPD